jgi:hypothetical protein
MTALREGIGSRMEGVEEKVSGTSGWTRSGSYFFSFAHLNYNPLVDG